MRNGIRLNILIQNASTVGAIDLKIIDSIRKTQFNFFDNLDNNKFKILYF